MDRSGEVASIFRHTALPTAAAHKLDHWHYIFYSPRADSHSTDGSAELNGTWFSHGTPRRHLSPSGKVLPENDGGAISKALDNLKKLSAAEMSDQYDKDNWWSKLFPDWSAWLTKLVTPVLGVIVAISMFNCCAVPLSKRCINTVCHASESTLLFPVTRGNVELGWVMTKQQCALLAMLYPVLPLIKILPTILLMCLLNIRCRLIICCCINPWICLSILQVHPVFRH